MPNDEEFMRLALLEAEKGLGWTSPNPMVGAVIVKDGMIISKGYHKKAGDLHAERNALAACSGDPKGATLYVTLEPCCHHGRTPPCTEAIIQSGISKVVVGALDPNPLVAGKGLKTLREHGINVIPGILEAECFAQNDVFFHFITHKTPFVAMKYAMTADGKTATATGKSKWITGEAARAHVHRLRHRYSAIMAGIGTILADDPLLTCRLPDCKNPIRIICDTNLRIPLASNIVKTALEVKTYIATAYHNSAKAEELEQSGCNILLVPTKDSHIDLCELMRLLGSIEIDSVLLEGGAALHGGALEARIVHKLYAYIAPKLFGGEGAKSAVGGRGIDSPQDAFGLTLTNTTPLGDDLLLEYRLK